MPARRLQSVLIGLTLTSLAGCGALDRLNPFGEPTPTEPYEAVLSRWVGRSENDLIAAWGVPTRSQLLSAGGQVLEYRRRIDDQTLCTTLFTSDMTGVIQSWTYRGNDCRPMRIGDPQP